LLQEFIRVRLYARASKTTATVFAAAFIMLDAASLAVSHVYSRLTSTHYSLRNT
jgi:hypothetical protein